MSSPSIERIEPSLKFSVIGEPEPVAVEAALYKPSTGSHVMHVIKKGGLYAGGVLFGLGPNMLFSFMALHGSMALAANTGLAIGKYNWHKRQFKNFPDDHPEKKRISDRLRYLEGELNEVGKGALTWAILAIPAAGPILVYKRYVNTLDLEMFFDRKLIDFKKDEGINKFIKTITFGLEGRYPDWAYDGEKNREANIPSKKLIAEKRAPLLHEGGAEFKIHTEDHRLIEALYIPGMSIKDRTRVSRHGPTAILFHGPLMVLDDLKPWISFYQERGINVLAITIDGYGKNQRSSLFKISQETIEADAKGALNYLTTEVGLPNNQILVHGMSTLAKMATNLAKNNKDIHLVLDQAGTNIETIATNFVKKYQFGKERLVKEFVEKELPGKLDCLGDIQHTQAGSFVALSALQDDLMGQGDLELQRFNQYNYSHELAQAYIKATNNQKNLMQHVIDFKGVHGNSFTSWAPAVIQMEKHLESIGFIKR